MNTRDIASAVLSATLVWATPFADVAVRAAESVREEAPREPFRLTGFRSAQFGMNEAAVRAAIAKDFPAQAKSPALETSSVEKTRALVFTVDDLVPESGPARMAYILGHKTAALIQVNVVWEGKGGGPARSRNLVDTSGQLSAYLMEAGYRPDTIAVNRMAPDGTLVVFRGSDENGRTAVLAMRGKTERKDKDVSFTPVLLQLSYVADPKAPDVFRLEKGKF